MAHAKFSVASSVTQASSGKSFSTAETEIISIKYDKLTSCGHNITEKVEPMLFLW